MNDVNALLAMISFGLAKLSRFNAVAGAFCGIGYGFVASLLDREFLGFGSTQLTLIGIACFVVFFALSIGLTIAGNNLAPNVDTKSSH